LKLEIEKFRPDDLDTGSTQPPGNPVPARIIKLRERSFIMLKKDLILRNPMRLWDKNPRTLFPLAVVAPFWPEPAWVKQL
jgi:hypothetical protein